MSAREEILGAVRRALAGASDGPAVPRGYRERALAGEGTANSADVVALFVERVEDYRAVVARCAADELADRVAEALRGAASVVVPEGLSADVVTALEVAGAAVGASVVPDRGQGALQLDEVDAVLTTAAVGIAETGTIVLDHGPGQGRRALSLVPDLHVCVVRADQVVRSVPAAVAGLDPTRPQTWISGPSATSDIELNRVEGVHGPRRLHVIVLA